MRVLRFNNAGFTLVEVMVAMLISLVGLMGLLKALEVAIQQNAGNLLRDEAVQVAEKEMASQKSRAFSVLTTSGMAVSVPSRVRNGSVSYTVKHSVSPTSPLATEKMITVLVTWNYRGAPYSHQAMSAISQ